MRKKKILNGKRFSSNEKTQKNSKWTHKLTKTDSTILMSDKNTKTLKKN